MTDRKILILTNRIPYPLNDGGNLAMHAMIEGYYMSGWKVYLLAMNTSRHSVPDEILTGLYKHIHAFEWVNINNDINKINVIKNFLFSKEAEHVERFYHQYFEDKIVDVLKNFKPHVVQVESVYLTTYMPAIKHHSDAVKVLRMHNIEYHIWHGLGMKAKNKIKRKYYFNLTERLKTFEREAWKKYDLVLPITEKDAFHVKRLEKTPDLLVAPFSIDMSKIRGIQREEKWVSYHIGAMDWIPNREAIRWFLSEVWPKIHNTIPKFEFYFAGRKMTTDFLEREIEGVHCMGEVENADEFIADKKILIVPVATTGGIRVKILEAMAAGKIIITSPEGIKGIEAKVGDHYLLARNPEDYVRAIKWCLMNKDKAEQMGRDAKQLVYEKYEYRSVIKTVIDALEVLLKLRDY
ncbi:MAG: glycosyltransferase [Taibaiella sp.]|nr:glycosyltransferase [Taibaiella sp.]